MHSSDSDSDSGWNKGLIAAVSKKHKKKVITEQDRISEMKDCLDGGADIDTVDENGNTVLHTAVKRGYRIIVEFLREAEARTDIPNNKGETAITLAENLGQQEIVSILKGPSTSQKSDLSSGDFSLNSSLMGPNRKRTVDAVDGNVDESLSKIRLIGLPRPDFQPYATSVGQRSNQKRTADDELGEHAKRLRKLTLIDVSQPDLHRSKAKGETYAASGLKRSLHGTVYQLKHLMLIVHRAWKIGYSFRLATEMDAAEKFDDVVLRYRDSDGDEVYRFVQAKHKQDETKMICASDLLDVKDGDFSLLKYFISWRKIKKHPDFREGKSKNFLLCTNIGLEVDGLKEKNINVSEIKDPDDFLMVTNRPRQPPRYKLLVENPSAMWDTLKSASDVHRVAKELAERVCGALDIQLNTDIIKSYHVALAGEVINVREKKFFFNFIHNNHLSDEAADFRKIFYLNTKRLLSKRNLSEAQIWKFLGDSSLKLSSTFGKKTQSAIKPEQIQSIKLPEDQVDDAEILRFLDEFILAVNQPNEVELGEMIKREIGVHGQLNLPDAGFVRDSFQIEILNWFKTKQGSFLQEKDADNFFRDMKVKLGSLKTMALSLEYSEKLKELGIQFNSENTELQNFMSCTDHTSNRVLEIISPKQTLLAALQVRQTLAQPRKCEENEGFIFVRLKTLLTPEIMKLVLPAFKWSHNHNLLVVDCESISAKQHVQMLWNLLYDILAKDVHKKMIVITQSGKDLGTGCSLSRQTYRVQYSEHTFGKFTNDSRKKLLGKQVTKFQGQNIEISFGELLGIRDCDNLRENELRDLSDIMDSELLVKLISGNGIHIGCDLDGLDAIQDYYISRTIFRHVFIKKDILKNTQIPDLLAIGGIDRALPCELVQMGETSLMTRDKLMCIEGTSVVQNPTNSITLDINREEEQFNALCAENEIRNIHWLKREQGKYIWKKSQGDITHLVQHRDYSETDDNDAWTDVTYLSEYQLTLHDEPVIISDTAGTGKSTMLTYVAWKMKEDKPDILVLKINLNHHATALADVKKTLSYNLRSINGAVQFLVKEVLNRETNSTRKVFKRIIETKHKVALIFDGFDEISPTYEGPVIDLLQTFADYGIKKLVVATRPHTRATLETKLNTFSYEILPFSTYDQERFLTEFWKAKFQDSHYDSQQMTEERIQKYTTAIMIKLGDSIKDQSNKFTGIPLQAKLVAEIFEDRSEGVREHFDSCKEFIHSEVDDPKFPEKINLIYLYENFVEKKFDVFFKKRGGNLADVAVMEDRRQRYKSFIEKHERLALDTLFDKDKITELLSQQDTSDRSPEPTDLDITVERDGIITQFIDGQPRFGHRTYAEYFAAKFFSNMLKKREQTEPLGKIFVADILLGENYKTMRAFIDWLLPDEYINALQGEFWPLYSNTHRSQRQETIFHVAAAEGNDRIIRLFLNCLYTNTKDQRDLIHVKDIFGRTAVHRAVEYGHLEKIKLLADGTDVEIDSRNILGLTPLYQAAQTATSDVVEYLIDRGANINFQDDNGFTPLHAAALGGKSDIARCLVDKGADINSQTTDGWTPLHVAAKEGKLNVVHYLLNKGADINFQTNDGWTPLHAAANGGKLALIEYLINKGVDINFQTKNGWTPLHAATEKGESDVVRFLLDNGAAINSQTNDGVAPLHAAAYQGKLDVTKHLLNNGADVNSRTNDGLTPLHAAVYSTELAVVKCLLDNKADINSQTNDGRTPLHVAAYRGVLDIVKHLVKKLADVNSQTNNGLMPLHFAAQEGKLDVVDHLLDKGADIHSQTEDGSMPLHIAAQGGKLNIVKYLLEKGADINSQTNNGSMPLYFGAREGKLNVVKCLLDMGANINCRTNHYLTPLHAAAYGGESEVVRYLLDKKADINSQTKTGLTPLHAAAIGGKLDLVKYLLDEGADINLQARNGLTPLEAAADAGHSDVVKYLLIKGADIKSQLKNFWTPLHAAVCDGELNLLKYLLEKGADIDSRAINGLTLLHMAASGGKLDILKYLLDKGADINSQMDDGWTPLHTAAYEGKFDIVKYLLDKGANINYQTSNRSVLLHAAIYGNKLDVVKYLLDEGADINSRRNNGSTPLHTAANGGKLPIVEYLLEKGADANSQTNDGWTPLHAAAYEGKCDVVKYLLDKGADVNSQANDGWMPLHAAAQEGQLNVVEHLLDKGANINSRTKDGWTPLYTAANCGQLDIVRCLLNKGADIDSPENDGATPLHVAAQEGKFEVTKYLLDKGADINSQTNNGWTPLYAAANGGQLDLVKYLLEKEVDINFKTNEGWTPLHGAAEKGELDVVEYLLENGADVNSRTNDGIAPLHTAAYLSKLDVTKHLLDNEADVNSKANNGLTPLHAAAYGAELAVVEYLLDNGADINSQTNDGVAPLHVAANEGKLDVAEYLIVKGADINSQTNNRSTPLHLAAEEGRLDMVKYLINKGARVDPHDNNGLTPLHLATRESKLNVVRYLLSIGCRDNA